MTDQLAPEAFDGIPSALPEAGMVGAQLVGRLFEIWNLTATEQASLLGTPLALEATLGVRCADQTAFINEEVSERLGHLVSIHAKLRTLFPMNRELAYRWMSTNNNAFDGRTPLAVVQDHGVEGMRMIRAYLDHQIGA